MFQKSFKDIVNLPELVDELDAEVRKEYYNSRMRCAGFMPHIADVLRKDFISEVQKHKPLHLLVDASNDKTSIAKLLF
jgi:hypothetical protein